MTVQGFILFQSAAAMLIPKAQIAKSNYPTLEKCARKMKAIEGFQSEIADLEDDLSSCKMFSLLCRL